MVDSKLQEGIDETNSMLDDLSRARICYTDMAEKTPEDMHALISSQKFLLEKLYEKFKEMSNYTETLLK